MKNNILKSLLVNLSLMSSAIGGSNYITIDINDLDYKRPDENRGSAGSLSFQRIRLAWDDMIISLDNNQSFLDADIKVNPRYLKFNTNGIGYYFPLKGNQGLFKVDQLKLSNSAFVLNQEFFNFSGDNFLISDGKSNLSLDKFNVYCDGEDDMTSGAGLIKGCLTEFVLNGQEEGELAGAKIEYKETLDDEVGIYYKGKLKSFVLKDSKYTLDIHNSELDVADFQLNLGTAKMICTKERGLYEFDIGRLKNSCLNELSLEAPIIEVINKVNETTYKINLEDLKTIESRINAEISKVDLVDSHKKTSIKNISINCMRNKDSEFYNLHKVIEGCVEDGEIQIDEVLSLGSGYENQIAQSVRAHILDNKLTLHAILDFPFVPKFKFKLEAYLVHDPINKTLGIDIIRYKALKVFKWRWLLLKILNFAIGSKDNIDVNNTQIIFKL